MKIYLDYNLFAYMYDETRLDLNAKVRALSDRHMFPYSPAHMEEIATAVMNAPTIETMDRLEAAMRKIDSVSQISRNVELFPVSSGPMVLKEEQPLACFRRVVLHYDKNPIVEENEEQILAFFKVGDPHGKLANKVSNLADDFLLNSDHGRDLQLKLLLDIDFSFRCKSHGVKDFTWPEISGHFPVLERAIELAMNFLEQSRYRPEHISKSRSRMHDVTHCIYATGCDQFVTHDKRLNDKVRAVYRYFGVPTRVLTLEEFVARDYD
ncbi:hypothetical protein AWB68_06431 [Caballeronia choica]|uniref:PIN domain-containing protein n=1 Tax=Caballeronia choica TaxID=326476 RepID=A0A158KMK3_9BURK|nr:hypothetical protein [Caballeronia choica]SAL82225.1 hypothetical protein AWB68_06431 [Caballeronia choica]